jgi:NADPH-dependent 2,4-dienoyl-CoA reductase/sulfur reductase-like enzyme
MKTARRIVIVGGVAGGASAAARARRVDESAEIHIFERGPYISFANCGLPYYIAGEIKDRSKLIIMTPENRHRGESHLSTPATPPDKRVRIRRFEGLSYLPVYSLGIPRESK